MSSYHAKIMEDDAMKITIHDCKSSIQLKNGLSKQEEVRESIEKLTTLSNGISLLIDFIKENYEQK